MTKFVLIDHSLKGVGGHHYDYAMQVLTAAEKAGYEVALASNRRFRRCRSLPQDWPVFPVFPHSTYNKFAVYAGSRSSSVRRGQNNTRAAEQASANEIDNPIQQRGWWHTLRRGRVVNGLTRACHKLFHQIELEHGDQVFVPTLSELDLEGLVNYLQADPRSRRADWHLQFHYNIFDGREPDYPRQFKRQLRVQRQFQDALSRLPEHRLHFYNTSEQLNAQYNRLEVARFEDLAYPINEAFYSPQREVTPATPLRVACGGAIRAEKGHQFLASLIEKLWPEYLARGKMQLLVQSNKSWFQLPLPDGNQPNKRQRQQRRPQLPDTDSKDPIVYIQHPLQVEDYVQHIRRSDVGLMLYDSARYYVRRAGVLGEYLAAGVPVIVPAGCWLSEQIAEPIFQHLQSLEDSVPLVKRPLSSEIAWQTEGNQDEVSFQGQSSTAVCTLDLPVAATDLRVGFNWRRPTEPGTYVRLRFAQYDDRGDLLDRFDSIVGHRNDGSTVATLVHLKPTTVRVKIEWQNAFHDGPIAIGLPAFTFFDASQLPAGYCPSGAVGLAASEPGQVPHLLKEMIDHHAHYRETAAEFSHDWMQRHDADRTVKQLLANAWRIAVDRMVA